MKYENSNILFSIRPKYIELITNGFKKFEYKNRYWKVEYPSWFYIYESSPICSLKYMFLLDHPLMKGEKIIDKTYGADRFNDLSMNRNYAYPILKIKQALVPITLENLREMNVTPPQDFIYVNRKGNLLAKLSQTTFFDL